MSENEGGLGRRALIVVPLAVFGFAILLVSFNATRGSEVNPITGEVGCPDLGISNTGRELFGPDHNLVDGYEGLGPLIQELEEGSVSGSCGGQTVMIVEGLPEVSGVYASSKGNLAIEGWSLDEGGYDQTVGRCYVDQDHQFRTKIVHSGSLEGDEEGGGVLTTIDVAITGGGDFAAAVREVGRVDGTALFDVTHNYNPGSGAVKALFDVWDEDNWTGVAIFESTGEAETYNNRDFSPWTDTQYQGQPNYSFTVILICT